MVFTFGQTGQTEGVGGASRMGGLSGTVADGGWVPWHWDVDDESPTATTV